MALLIITGGLPLSIVDNKHAKGMQQPAPSREALCCSLTHIKQYASGSLDTAHNVQFERLTFDCVRRCCHARD